MSKHDINNDRSSRVPAEKDLRTSLGQRIARMRGLRGWNQGELAKRMGVARTRVGRWERGTTLPPLGTLIALSSVLETTLDALIAGRTSETAGLTPDQRQQAARHLNQLAGLLRLRARE